VGSIAARTWSRIRPIAVFLSVVAFVVAPEFGGGGAAANSLADRIAAARERRAALERSIGRQRALAEDLREDQGVARSAIDGSERQLRGVNADQAAIRREIVDATQALERSEARQRSLTSELHSLDYLLGLLDQAIAEGSDDLDARRRLLGERLADAYRTGRTSLLDQLLTTGSFTDVVTKASAYLSYGDQDLRLAQAIAADQAALDDLRALTITTRFRADQVRRAAQAAEADLRGQRARLFDARARAERLEARVREVQRRQLDAARRIAHGRRAVARLVARQAAADRRLERRIAGLVAEAQRRAAARERARRARERREREQGGLREGRGRFDWPTTGYVTQEYGCTGFPLEPPRGSCAHFHSGIDIANGPGTPVRAADDGVVAFAGWNPYDPSDPAFVVVIGHTGGYETYYGHLLPRYVVRAGQYVRKGKLIGYMGSTGNSTGTHLHWEVSRNGRTVDPRSRV
jgi:murein DD-endopeptidase MepM/ murein hydrolase activator NlpD